MGVNNALQSGARLELTAGLPASGVLTICGWSTVTSPTSGAGFQCLFFMEDASEDFGINFRNTDGVLIIDTSGAVPTGFASSPTAGQRFFWAVTHAGAGAGNLIGYWALSGATTLNSANMGGKTVTPTSMWLLGNPYSQPYDGSADNVKMWTAVLSAAELLNEMNSTLPRRFANLYDRWPLWRLGDTKGYYGAHNWTETGSLTSTDNGPVGGDEEADVYYFTDTALTGSIAITGSGATLAMEGTSVVGGTLAITGNVGAVAMAGTTNVAGAMAITGEVGSVVMAGTSLVEGAMAITGSGATLAILGGSDSVGDIAITGSGATLAMEGSSVVSGAIAITGSGATLAMAGTTNVAGAVAIVGNVGTVAMTGTSNVAGSIAITGNVGVVDMREAANSGEDDDMFLIM
jgi:hypothetical protein